MVWPWSDFIWDILGIYISWMFLNLSQISAKKISDKHRKSHPRVWRDGLPPAGAGIFPGWAGRFAICLPDGWVGMERKYNEQVPGRGWIQNGPVDSESTCLIMGRSVLLMSDPACTQSISQSLWKWVIPDFRPGELLASASIRNFLCFREITLLFLFSQSYTQGL